MVQAKNRPQGLKSIKPGQKSKTTVGTVDSRILEYTAGADPRLDLALTVDDCVGTAAHAVMLSRMPVTPPVLTRAEAGKIIRELRKIIAEANRHAFKISTRDQDVHLAVERRLTAALGDIGRKVHTARSRNDQVAVDLRLYARRQLLFAMEETAKLSEVLVKFAKKNRSTPMPGRTHMRPAMPGSVGLWASSYTEGLLDDCALLDAAYNLNNACPLGAAAGYGVTLPIDRKLTSRLLGFKRPIHNVLHAINARGKTESVVLFALGQVMLTLSRLAADLIVFSAPEFGYFTIPAEYCTGSSIMPQKQNPDVLELVRAKAARVFSSAMMVGEITRGLPGGYNRDLQETKAPLMEGISETRATLRILPALITALKVNRSALLNGFDAEIFAADNALDLVRSGVPFRTAYDKVKAKIGTTASCDPAASVGRKTHLGAPAGLDFGMLENRAKSVATFAGQERKRYCHAVSNLLGTTYSEKG
ncbi:MAG: argininosuccinate lyase [Lentisphaerales bacterium]|nr:MAG: argininosuccinate lyase [Lentisphaerales bacterium]